jgi:ABC-type cobalamin transport system ATPase subunit
MKLSAVNKPNRSKQKVFSSQIVRKKKIRKRERERETSYCESLSLNVNLKDQIERLIEQISRRDWMDVRLSEMEEAV